MTEPTYKKKLIEVALPLDAINAASKKEKDRKIGKPQQIHHWWARRPIVSARAVLFAQLVDDPSAHPERFPTAEAQATERQRLFRVLEQLVDWDAWNKPEVIAAAAAEIVASNPSEVPGVVDPFCGGGSIPMEAQRLGLRVFASDLNPVAVLITKGLIEIPQRCIGRSPVAPTDANRLHTGWPGVLGLVEDVKFFGERLRAKAVERLQGRYPEATLPSGDSAPVIAWIWARTAPCPNPACGRTAPLLSTLWLAKKKQNVYLQPQVTGDECRFEVLTEGSPGEGLRVGRGKFRCVFCDDRLSDVYLRECGARHSMGQQLIAMVVATKRGRVYLPASPEHESVALRPADYEGPHEDLPSKALGFRVQAYGMTRHVDIYTQRQLNSLCVFADLVAEIANEVRDSALGRGMSVSEADQYAGDVCVYLALTVSRMADWNNSLCGWESTGEVSQHLFTGQSVKMTWDYSEANPLANSTGSYSAALSNVVKSLEMATGGGTALVQQADVVSLKLEEAPLVVTTDPPYYGNIGYSDISDIFYVWLRRAIGFQFRDLFSTLLTPKKEEIIAAPHRFGGSGEAAKDFFEERFGMAFARLAALQSSSAPLVLFYAFKQEEVDSSDGSTASTGWETMLTGLINAGLMVSATWPVRTEMASRVVGQGANALASSIVLACRPRMASAGITDRRGFLEALRSELPGALREMQQGSVAPVDLAQSSIGPGMAVFSRYAKVLEPSGEPMRVRAALGLINQVLDEVLAEQEGDFDAETRWAVKWFSQYGFDAGPFGDAETLCKATGTAVNGMERSGILESKAAKVWLIGRADLPADWDPAADDRIPVWEAAQHLVKALDEGGEQAAAELLAALGGVGETARDLAYRLYAICDAKKWAKEAGMYNALVASWPEIRRKAAQGPSGQGSLL